MSAGIYRLEVPVVAPRDVDRIRQACIDEGLIEPDELLDLDDWRFYKP